MITVPHTIKRIILKPRIVQKSYYWYWHFRTDCYVISYPKSGRTWLKVMLAKALALYFDDPRDVVFQPKDVIRRAQQDGPYIRFSHNGAGNPPDEERKQTEKRYRRYEQKRVVFLIRDPRDVVVSFYFHRTRRLNEEHTLSEFVRHPWWGIDRTIAFMNGWYSHRQVPAAFLLVRYEDLHRDAAKELRRVLAFVNLDEVSDQEIAESVAYAHFDNLRQMSLNKLGKVDSLAPIDPQDPESFKVRKGEVGGYKRYLSTADLEYIDERIRRKLTPAFWYTNSGTQ